MPAPSAGCLRRWRWMSWMASSCDFLLFIVGLFVFGGASGKGEEHFVETRLSEREIVDHDVRAGKLRERLRNEFRVRNPRRERRRVRAGLHCNFECVRENLLRLGTLLGVSQPDVQSARTYRRFQLARRAPGDDPSVVDDGDAVG